MLKAVAVWKSVVECPFLSVCLSSISLLELTALFFKGFTCVFKMCLYAHLCPLSALGAPEGPRALDPLELELQAAVSSLT